MSQVVLKDGKEILIRSLEDEKTGFSFLDVVESVDRLPSNYSNMTGFKENVYSMESHDGIPIGFVLKFVVLEIERIAHSLASEIFEVSHEECYLRFKSKDFDERSNNLDKLGLKLKLNSNIKSIKNWRNEKYAIYTNKTPYVLIERALSSLFGIITYGIHINGFVKNPKTGNLSFWIPRRAANKPTWPLMLDNIVAGGLAYPYGVYETALKESMEEASLNKKIVEKSIHPTGSISYIHFQGDCKSPSFQNELCFITGEIQYIFDMELSPNIIPTVNDGEVDSFNLLSLQETIDAIKNQKFKPNSALVMVEFLIRHGYINSENDPNYCTLVHNLHRQLPFPIRG